MSLRNTTEADILRICPGATIRGGKPALPAATPDNSSGQTGARPARRGRHEIRIPGWMPTPLNRLMNVHWSTRRRMKTSDSALIKISVAHWRVPIATGKRRVSLRITLPPRKRSVDPDSLWKSLLDALVHCGALVNDSAKWCELGMVEFVRGDALETVITLDDV